MLKTIKASITYKLRASHESYKSLKDKEKDQKYSDHYNIDLNNFYGTDHIIEYIRNDLLLIAGGGYDSKNIYDYRIIIDI